MKEKLSSRKFWNALLAEITGIVVLICGASAGEHFTTIAGAAILIAATLGYLKAEKDIDVAKESNKNRSSIGD